MISYNDALRIIRQATVSHRLQSETVPLSMSLGRVCSESVAVKLNIPPFDNAAMDGFALRFSDVAHATQDKPVILKKLGLIGAGDAGHYCIESGTCWHIMTGAPLPQNAECIIPVENATLGDSDTVMFHFPAKLGQHIRRTGEDFQSGAYLPLVGERVTSAHIMPLAAIGTSTVSVFRKPRILFISTGAEIVDDLSAPLPLGKIYNSNQYFAKAFLDHFEAHVTIEDTIPDDPAAFSNVINKAMRSEFDIIISSGAVSMGAYDFVKDGLNACGAEVLYHKIKLKPGKPNLFARLPNGALYFGLPGNPVATAVGLRFFVMEALRVLNKQKPEQPLYAKTANNFSKKLGLHMVLKGRSESLKDGSLNVHILDGQESFMVSPFLKMNNWVHIGENVESIKAGDILEIYPFMPHECRGQLLQST
jgi:molybdopterin molybdotransferase